MGDGIERVARPNQEGNGPHPEPVRAGRWLPLAIFALALALRLAFILSDPAPLASDERDYDQLGWSLAQTGRYAVDGVPTAYRAPGYPALIAAVYTIAGRRPETVKTVQAVLDSLTAVLLYMLLRRRNRLAAPVAGLAWALFPPAVLFSGHLLSEAPFTFGVVGFALLVDVRGVRNFDWVAGLLLGGLILMKPMMLLFAAAVPWALSRPRGARTTEALLSMALLPVMLWLLRNLLVVGAPALTTSTGVNLLIGNNPAATGGYMDPPGPSEPTPSGEWQADVRAGRAAVAFVSRAPVDALRLEVRKLALLVSSEAELAGGTFSRQPSGGEVRFRDRYRAVPSWLRFLVSFPTAVIFLLGAFGLATRYADSVGRTFLALVSTTVATTAVFFGGSRFHFPLMPFLVLFAAEFALDPLTKIRSVPRRPLLIAAAACGLIAAVWVGEAWFLFGNPSASPG